MPPSHILSRFTMETIKRLEPAEAGKRKVLHHPRIEGLVLRVTDTGTKTFCFVGRPKGGAMIRQTLGTFPKLTVDQAERMAKELQNTLAQGELPSRKNETKETLAALVDWYIRLPGARKESTNTYYRNLASQYLKPLAKRQVGSVQRGDIAELHRSLTQNRGVYVANRLISLVRAAYHKAMG